MKNPKNLVGFSIEKASVVIYNPQIMGTENGDRSKRDPLIAERLLGLSTILTSDKFPKPRIENLGQKTADRLAELKKTLGKRVLGIIPQGDELVGIYENYLFLREDVFPIVSELMERTANAIVFDKQNMLGCYFLFEEDGGEDRVELAIDDESDIFDGRITSLESVQELWDKSTVPGRKALKKFSKMSKGKLLKFFEEYAREYSK